MAKVLSAVILLLGLGLQFMHAVAAAFSHHHLGSQRYVIQVYVLAAVSVLFYLVLLVGECTTLLKGRPNYLLLAAVFVTQFTIASMFIAVQEYLNDVNSKMTGEERDTTVGLTIAAAVLGFLLGAFPAFVLALHRLGEDLPEDPPGLVPPPQPVQPVQAAQPAQVLYMAQPIQSGQPVQVVYLPQPGQGVQQGQVVYMPQQNQGGQGQQGPIVYQPQQNQAGHQRQQYQGERPPVSDNRF